MTSISAASVTAGPFDRSWVSNRSKDSLQVDTTPEALSELLEAVAERGDRSAFARLFEWFAPRIKGFIQKRGVGPAQAEDLAQDVMLTVWRRAGLYRREHGSVSTWIFTIARNRHIDVIRRERRPEIDFDDPTLTSDAARKAKRFSHRRKSHQDCVPRSTRCRLIKSTCSRRIFSKRNPTAR